MSEHENILTAKGRIIFHSLFEKDSYKDPVSGAESKPQYKLDLAMSEEAMSEYWDHVYGVMIEATGKTEDEITNLIEGGFISVPIKDGDELAAARAARGKDGSAMAGLEILRSHTSFNAHGEDGPGGIYVVDQYNNKVEWDNRSIIYSGCYVRANVSFKYYQSGSNTGVTCYLNGVQFAEDGDRLGGDKSSLFGALNDQKPKTGRRGRKAE